MARSSRNEAQNPPDRRATDLTWEDIWDVFHQAIAADERGEVLDRLCATRPELRQKVEDLLEAHARRQHVLSRPVFLASSRPEEDPLLGERIGPYLIDRHLGEGGMGVVYAAEQLEPVRRPVALKVIKLGMDTREVLARFEAERQALALMNHPNIATAYDAGATADGRPYFAMEYVDGAPVDIYCDRERLDVRQRLELFRRICAGVQHAHQKGIIHRDLKPSNVLVTGPGENGAPGVPKVIDFGIAKAMGPRLSECSLHTEVGRWVGTPEYLSPERLATSGIDVDTRADVYSLGMLLYKLLVGALPFGAEVCHARSLEEILRQIREEEIPRPSVRFAALTPDQAAQAAGDRQARPRELARELRSDLDWILNQALAKDRDRRYATADELAADVARYLARQPVLAGPPSVGYRLRKFVERHRYRVLTACAVLFLLSTFSVVLAFQTVRLGEALVEAEGERERAEQVTRFLVSVFGPGSAGVRSPDVTAREVLDHAATRLERDRDGPLEVRRALYFTLGEGYHNLGLEHLAASMYEKLVELERQSESASGAGLGNALHHLGTALGRAGELDTAEPHLLEALGLRLELYGGEHLEVAATLHEIGSLLLRRADFAASEKYLRRSLALRQDLGGDPLILAKSVHQLGTLLFQRGRMGEAESLLREALAVRRRHLGEEHADVAAALNNLALVLENRGAAAEAESMHRRSFDIWSRMLPAEHPRVSIARSNLATTLYRRGAVAEAIELLESAVESLQASLGEHHPTVLASLHNIAEMRYRSGDSESVEPLLRDVLERRRAVLPADHPDITGSLVVLGELVANRGAPQEAEPMLREALSMRRRSLDAGHRHIGSASAALGSCLTILGRFTEAEPLLHESFDILARHLSEGDPTFERSTRLIENLYRDWNRPERLAAWRRTLAAKSGPDLETK